jgi:thymidine phosphorylase
LRPGRVLACDVRAVGLAVVGLGGGRLAPQDAIDPCVGFERLAGLGDVVDAARPLALVHAADEDAAERASAALRAAYLVGEGGAPDRGPLRERRPASLLAPARGTGTGDVA